MCKLEMSTIQVQVVDRVTPEFADRPALSSTAAAPTSGWARFVFPATTLFVARSDDTIVGMFTLLLFQILTGLRAILEDLIVFFSYRRKGVGEQLMRAALVRARSAGARTVDFTSRPSRETVQRLYLRLGFAVRDTQVYRYAPDRDY